MIIINPLATFADPKRLQGQGTRGGTWDSSGCYQTLAAWRGQGSTARRRGHELDPPPVHNKIDIHCSSRERCQQITQDGIRNKRGWIGRNLNEIVIKIINIFCVHIDLICYN